MPITRLKTFEGVPLGKNNFDDYLSYIRELISRSNPFIETSTDDENRILGLGSGVSLAAADTTFAGVINNEFVTLEPDYGYWDSSKSYIFNFKINEPFFSDPGFTGVLPEVQVYFAPASLLPGTSGSLTSSDVYELLGYKLQTIEIEPSNTFYESFVYRPVASTSDMVLVFHVVDSSDYSVSLTIDTNLIELSNGSLINISGESLNSSIFITNDLKELYALRTNYIDPEDFNSPDVKSWEIPLASVTEVSFSPNERVYAFEPDLIPDNFNKLSFNNYEVARSTDYGDDEVLYNKGFILTTINGIPQITNKLISATDVDSGFYSKPTLVSSDYLQITSMRLGAEFPEPSYTNTRDRQFAYETLGGFFDVNASETGNENSLAGPRYLNTLFFPYTDFLINPTLILIHYDDSESVNKYYYIPQDKGFSSPNDVLKNHYKVIDTSTGEVRFNFNLSIRSSGDKFWIVSAEQLAQTVTQRTVEYSSTFANVYSPSSNTEVPITVIAFDPTLLVDADLELELPQAQLIPPTRIIGSAGGAIFSDSEGEFNNLVVYGISYPARFDVDEIIKAQVRKFEPDILKVYYYTGTVAEDVTPSTSFYPVYITILDNDVSWYNRGLNFATYDPVSRSDMTSIGVSAVSNVKPANSSRLSETKRKSRLAAIAGSVDSEDVNFITGLFPNSFLVSLNDASLQSVAAPAGSLLVGNGSGAAPSSFPKGADNTVLTSTSTTLNWRSFTPNSTANTVVSRDSTGSFYGNHIVASDVLSVGSAVLPSDDVTLFVKNFSGDSVFAISAGSNGTPGESVISFEARAGTSTSVATGSIRFEPDSLSNTTASRFAFYTKDAGSPSTQEVFRIDSLGRVGIKTDSFVGPQEALDVSGNISVGSSTGKAVIRYTDALGGTYTIPYVGSTASFVMTAGDQTLAGTKTFSVVPSFPTQSERTFFASPDQIGGGVPVFRALVPSDIPTLTFSAINDVLPISKGGTGTNGTGITARRFFSTNSSGVLSFRAIEASDLPFISGGGSSVSFPIEISQGGTGVVGSGSAAAAYRVLATQATVSSLGFTTIDDRHISSLNLGAMSSGSKFSNFLSTTYGGTGVSVAPPNRVFAGPPSGPSNAAPAFRTLVSSDLPNISASKIEGVLEVANGGTGTSGPLNARRVFSSPLSSDGYPDFRELTTAYISDFGDYVRANLENTVQKIEGPKFFTKSNTFSGLTSFNNILVNSALILPLK